VIRRVFWFALGAGVAIFVLVKIRNALRSATPQAVGQRVADQAVGLGASARDFTERVRAAMAEREAEIRSEFGLPE
jgi:Family of unknown function (DUF6167)